MGIINSGFIYQKLIDPALSSIHDKSLSIIEPDLNIIDAACGTGAFAFKMSEKAKTVTGIDVSEEMISTAIKTQQKLGLSNLNFMVADANDLHQYHDDEFDMATISLAIHQFNTKTGILVLKELKRVSREILIVDYASPLPKNIYKSLIYAIERIAGKEHFNNFKTFQKLGGVEYYFTETGLKKKHELNAGKDNFSIIRCSK